jgi:hypothetical protein
MKKIAQRYENYLEYANLFKKKYDLLAFCKSNMLKNDNSTFKKGYQTAALFDSVSE